jgi:hypothetical protein
VFGVDGTLVFGLDGALVDGLELLCFFGWVVFGMVERSERV